MWSPFIMQKLISDNRLFEFIQKKKGYLNLRRGKTYKVSQKNTFRARGLARVNYDKTFTKQQSPSLTWTG